MNANLHHNNYKLMYQEEKALRMIIEKDRDEHKEMTMYYGEQLMALNAEVALLKQELLREKRKVC